MLRPSATTIVSLLLLLLSSLPMRGEGFDLALLQRINEQNSPTEVLLSKGLSDSGLLFAVGVPSAMALYGWIEGDATSLNRGIEIGASVVATVAVTTLLKEVIKRPRPYDKYPHDITPYRMESSYSFPSGHTSSAFALATSLSLNLPQWYVVLPSMLWATGVGYSRMSLGVHYPSDVLCGAVLGAGTAYLTHRANQWWQQRKGSRASNSVLTAYNMR